jgi:hypothetical protein
MCQPYPRIKIDQYPLAQFSAAFLAKTTQTVRLLVLAFLLSASLNAKAGDAPSGDPAKVVWQNPTPQLSQNAKRSLLAAQLGGLDSSGYMLVIVKLEGGKATEVRSLMSSGALLADKEICQFVLDHWVFNPKAQGVYKFPVLLPPGL